MLLARRGRDPRLPVSFLWESRWKGAPASLDDLANNSEIQPTWVGRRAFRSEVSRLPSSTNERGVSPPLPRLRSAGTPELMPLRGMIAPSM